MNLLEHMGRQFAYDEWANRQVLAALNAGTRSNPRSQQLLAHILSAERLWLERIQGKNQSLAVWPDFSIEECQRRIDELAALWTQFLGQISPDSLSQSVTYNNSKGEPWTSTVEDILTHVLLHSAYHRGQIAAQMRANGNQPAYTDFIHAARQGLIE